MPLVEIPGRIRIHCLEEGAGPPILWLPGGNDCAALLLHAHRSLAQRVRSTEIANAGHALFADNPNDYFATLNGFLDMIVGSHAM